MPAENYNRRTSELDARWFQEFADQEGIGQFVVGLPVHHDGSESAMSTEARQFGAWLAEVTGRQVTYFDERFTSVEAAEILGHAKLTKKRRQARLDKIAAQVLLTAYLESTDPDHDEPKSLDD